MTSEQQQSNIRREQNCVCKIKCLSFFAEVLWVWRSEPNDVISVFLIVTSINGGQSEQVKICPRWLKWRRPDFVAGDRLVVSTKTGNKHFKLIFRSAVNVSSDGLKKLKCFQERALLFPLDRNRTTATIF